MKKISVITLFALLVTFLPFQKTYALSCIEPPPPEVAIHKYDVVVIGTVTKVEDSTFLGYGYDLGKGTEVEANVSLSFKGYNSNTITFSEDFQWGESKVGTEYLLFLNKEGNGFESPLCSPTSKTAGLDMAHLIETLSAESTSVIELDKTIESDDSKFSFGPTFYILIFVVLIMIAFIMRIFYRRRKDKRNGEK